MKGYLLLAPSGALGSARWVKCLVMLTSMGNYDTLEARFSYFSIYISMNPKTEIAPDLSALDEELEFDIELENELKNLTSTLEMRKISLPDGAAIFPEGKERGPVGNSINEGQGKDKDEEDNGWRIARQAMVRDFLVLSGRGLVGFGALLIVGFACFFAYQKLSVITPQSLMSSARQIFPVLDFVQKPKVEDTQIPAVRTDTAESREKVRAKVTAARPRVKLAKRKVAAKPNARRYSPYAAWSSDSPRGGDITYYDGTITEYTWH